jgi:folate-binding protein YgfZ
MAVRTVSTPMRSSAFVCDACLSGFRPSRAPRFATIRAYTASSIANSAGRPIQQQPRWHKAATWRPIQSVHSKHTVSRQYSATNDASQPTTSGIAPLPHRRLISLSGPDSAKFLQGLITNNVDPAGQSPFYSAFLDARGRVLWDVFIWVYPELVAEKGHWSCFIEVDESEAEALKKHLKRHKLRSKIEVKDAGEQYKVWAAWGQASANLNSGGLVTAFPDPRAPDLWRGVAHADQAVTAEGLETADTQQYHLHRYLNGIAEGPHEIARESALPMEYNIDLSQGINFKKGCYVGQELTIRTKHTGVVRKRVLPVQLYSSTSNASSDFPIALPEFGADVKQLDEAGVIKKGRATGKFLAGIGNVGLALCRLEMMTPMKISAEGGTWKPEVEFGVSVGDAGEVIKVRPVLHDWFVLRERDMWDKSRKRL